MVHFSEIVVIYKFLDSTIGLIKYCFSPKLENATLVQQIINLGGIPFVKTNVPQTLMSFECSNPLWGATLNSYNEKLSPGGSSGGEAALIRASGSIIGIGRYVCTFKLTIIFHF